MSIKKANTKLKNTYEREIENKPLNNIIFALILSFLINAATIIFGIRPTLLTITKNHKYKKELGNINNLMTEKINKIEEGKKQIKNNPEEIDLINKKIPNEPNFKEFIDELVSNSVKSEFTVLRMTRNENNTATLSLQGRLYKIPNLISDIEKNMNRFAKIMSIKTQKEIGENHSLVEIKLKTYSLAENSEK